MLCLLRHPLQRTTLNKYVSSQWMRKQHENPSPNPRLLNFRDSGWFSLLTIWAFFFFPPLTSCALNSGFCMLNWPIKAEPSETLGSPLPINKSRTPGLWPHSVASGEPCAFPDLWVINFSFSNFLPAYCWGLSTANWHLPSTSMRIKLWATIATDLQHPLKGTQGANQEWVTLCSGKKW